MRGLGQRRSVADASDRSNPEPWVLGASHLRGDFAIPSWDDHAHGAGWNAGGRIEADFPHRDDAGGDSQHLQLHHLDLLLLAGLGIDLVLVGLRLGSQKEALAFPLFLVRFIG